MPRKPAAKKTASSAANTTAQFAERFQRTPNLSAGLNERLGVVLHHTGGSYSGAVSWLCNPTARASAHVVIAENGERTQLASDGAITWHAGRSRWRNRAGCNAFTLGVEFAGDTNQRPLTQEQIDSFVEWFLPRAQQYKWSVEDITDHRTVSPGRKVDLAETEFNRVLDAVRQALKA